MTCQKVKNRLEGVDLICHFVLHVDCLTTGVLLLLEYFSLSHEIFQVCFICSFCLCTCPELPGSEQLSSACTKWGNKEKASLYFGSPSVERFEPSVIYQSFDQMELWCPPSLHKNWAWSCEPPSFGWPQVLPVGCFERHFLCVPLALPCPSIHTPQASWAVSSLTCLSPGEGPERQTGSGWSCLHYSKLYKVEWIVNCCRNISVLSLWPLLTVLKTGVYSGLFVVLLHMLKLWIIKTEICIWTLWFSFGGLGYPQVHLEGFVEKHAFFLLI